MRLITNVGHINHSFFWKILAPSFKDCKPCGGQAPIGSRLIAAIESTFSSLKAFQDAFNKQAAGVFGSGWGWLVSLPSSSSPFSLSFHKKVYDPTTKALKIITTKDQEVPFDDIKYAILGVDVWEHAYYLKYKANRMEVSHSTSSRPLSYVIELLNLTKSC